MARFVVEEESEGPANESRIEVHGLAVAKALARKKARQGSVAILVREVESGRVLARYEPTPPKAESPSLAESVQRMRSANDRLSQALRPPARTKRGA
jgi:hypothetical protein